MNRFLGLLIIGAGPLVSYILYSTSQGKLAWNFELAIMLAVATFISVISFSIFKKKSNLTCFLLGSLSSYLMFFLCIYFGSRNSGAEALMWMPVALIVSIPYLSPIVICTFMGIRIQKKVGFF